MVKTFVDWLELKESWFSRKQTPQPPVQQPAQMPPQPKNIPEATKAWFDNLEQLYAKLEAIEKKYFPFQRGNQLWISRDIKQWNTLQLQKIYDDALAGFQELKQSGITETRKILDYEDFPEEMDRKAREIKNTITTTNNFLGNYFRELQQNIGQLPSPMSVHDDQTFQKFKEVYWRDVYLDGIYGFMNFIRHVLREH